ncbi:adenosylcobinamide-GDP ribazoletransferase [Bacillus canaveralius]|uniref:Adenosylcobinamide-GDP ribazoletransferase n=1 Tax=Bacillus canaveralius TaxID=1403243 RepID=A0A2N5GRY7_9BACI|nr:adenosylcobinamide-GDP ribazoletransferase [Bacillus canaveralius]PLR86312.1 adenosylcobinamide-GDP ribazoletransferase [Bacillus canaveralius]PLR98545.1 adenosylcobinamide-GDP ribazoletransferase [Bacillus canaveralius]
MLKGLLLNLQLFSSIPIRIQLPMDAHHLQKAVQTFPLLGLFQGLIIGGAFFGLTEFTPLSALATAFVVWLLMIVLTGGIHLDGWIDTSDAFFSYQDQDKRLEIMKDPRTGAFGVLSVIVLLSGKFLFIYELAAYADINAAAWVVAIIPFLSKSLMGYYLVTLPPAREEGMARFFANAVDRKSLWPYLLYTIVIIVASWLFVEESLLTAVILLTTSICAGLYGKIKIIKWFGGVTGDVVGASAEGMEFFLWMIVWLLHCYVMV